jgi:hypothetical protein
MNYAKRMTYRREIIFSSATLLLAVLCAFLLTSYLASNLANGSYVTCADSIGAVCLQGYWSIFRELLSGISLYVFEAWLVTNILVLPILFFKKQQKTG